MVEGLRLAPDIPGPAGIGTVGEIIGEGGSHRSGGSEDGGESDGGGEDFHFSCPSLRELLYPRAN
jgi:hypothetical protein